jgi:hypothetical protein
MLRCQAFYAKEGVLFKYVYSFTLLYTLEGLLRGLPFKGNYVSADSFIAFKSIEPCYPLFLCITRAYLCSGGPSKAFSCPYLVALEGALQPCSFPIIPFCELWRLL